MADQKTTIYHVARVAGVSTAAVSSVLNGKGNVSAVTEAAIRAAMAELGFQPRPYRQRSLNLAKKRSGDGEDKDTGQILFLVSDPDPASARTYQMQHIARGAAEFLGEFNLEMLVANLAASGRVPACLREGQVKGVILRGGPDLTAAQIKALSSLPCVEFFTTVVHARWDGVLVDDAAAARMAVQHLADQGAKRLIAINLDRSNQSMHLRAEMFRFYAGQAGLPVTVVDIEGRESLDAALPAVPRRRDGRHGVFIAGYTRANDSDTVTGLLSRRGWLENRYVSTVSMSTSPVVHPALVMTLERIGRCCAEQIVWRMRHPEADPRRIMVSPLLMPGVVSKQGASLPGLVAE